MNSLPSFERGQRLKARTASDRDRSGLEFEGELDRRPVNPNQEPVHRVLVLRHDAAPHEERHQRRNEKDRQERRRGHGEGLGVGELEQPALLRFQGEDGQERHGDDEKAEEERGTHLDRGLDHDLGPRLAGGARSSRLCAFSIMTMAASTIAPMAMAMPPRS